MSQIVNSNQVESNENLRQRMVINIPVNKPRDSEENLDLNKSENWHLEGLNSEVQDEEENINEEHSNLNKLSKNNSILKANDKTVDNEEANFSEKKTDLEKKKKNPRFAIGHTLSKINENCNKIFYFHNLF